MSCPIPSPILPIKDRNELGQMLNDMNFTHGVELGVQMGLYSKIILERWKKAKEYMLVDLWRSQSNYDDIANVKDKTHELFMTAALKNVKPFQHRTEIKVCRHLTTKCVQKVPNSYFDFIYVDARHDYKGVMQDLKQWWPKLRCGGIFAGHDYVDQNDVDTATSQGLKQQDWTRNYDGTKDTTRQICKGAVNDFASRVSRQISVTYRESNWNTWMIKK